MTLRNMTARLLAAALLFSTIFGGTQTAFGLSYEETTTDAPYQSVLTIVDGEKASYNPGDTVTVQLSVSPTANATPFAIRSYDNILTLDTTSLTITGLTPAAVLAGKTFTEGDYNQDLTARERHIRWVLTDQNPEERTEPLVLGTIGLAVTGDAAGGSTTVTQALEGLSVGAASDRATNVAAEPLNLPIADNRASYRFGLEITGEEKETYQAGDEITVKAYVTSSAVNFTATDTVNKILVSSDSFEVKSVTPQTGVLKGENSAGTDQVVTLTYHSTASVSGSRVELATLVLKVKPEAEAGLTAVRQSELRVNESGEAREVSGATLYFSIAKVGSCSFEAVIRDAKEEYRPGDQIVIDLAVKTAEPFRPRLVNGELDVPADLAIVSVSPAAAGSAYYAGSVGQSARWAYYDQSALQKEGSLELGSVTLEVKNTATVGDLLYINQGDHNLAAWDGSVLTEYEDVADNSLTVKIAEAIPVTYRLTVESNNRLLGTVTSGGAYEAGAQVSILATPNEGGRFAGWTATGGSFSDAGAAATIFTMPAADVTVTANFEAVLAGTVSIDGAARFGETLTANVSGIAPAGATCDLAWYRAGAAEAVATGATYTLTAADIGKVITLKATGTGAYTGELTAATTAVEKAAGPAAPAAPALASKTGATVTLTTVSGQEYRKGTDGQWQTDGLFSGLTAGTRYEFYTRVAETGTHQAGAVSPALAVTTDTYAIHMESGGTVLTSGAVALSLGTATEDYTSAESATITIRNSGTGTVTGLKAALSGAGANSFTLGALSANEIAQGASAAFTAAPKTGLAVGTHRATVTVTADNSVTESFDVTFEVTAKAAGVAVSGRFTSYDPKKVATITLTNDADASKVYSVTVGAISGQGQNAADFTLEGVTAGTYTLVITKPTHLSFTVKNIVVGETDVDLTTDSRTVIHNMVMICGDLDDSGTINADDKGILTDAGTFNVDIALALTKLADLDGSNTINADDLGILTDAVNFNQSAPIIE